MGIASLNPSYTLQFIWYLARKSHQENIMPHQRIEIDPDIMDGKPVVRGTRIPVEFVLRKLSADMSPEAILADHPRLTLDDIRAARTFAADHLAGGRL